jgi:Protein of unknown function (DUF3455)
MIKRVGTIMTGLALWTIGVFAQQVTLPATLDVPSGNRLFLHVYAKGVQIYRCTQDKNDTSAYVWTFVAPAADLFTAPDYTTATGKHYAGPTWEATDGSKAPAAPARGSHPGEELKVPYTAEYLFYRPTI